MHPHSHQLWMCHQDMSLPVPFSRDRGSPSSALDQEHLQNFTPPLQPQVLGGAAIPPAPPAMRPPAFLPKRESLGFWASVQLFSSHPCTMNSLDKGIDIWLDSLDKRRVCVTAGSGGWAWPTNTSHQRQVFWGGGLPAFQNHRLGHARQAAGLYLLPGRGRKKLFCLLVTSW